MATIQLKFGTLSLNSTNNITIGKISEKCEKPVKTTAVPKIDGMIAETAKLGAKTINIEGDIAGSSYDSLRTNLDALHAGLLNGVQKLTKDNERYIYCQLKSFNYAYDHMTRRATWTAQFVAHDPFWYSEATKSDVTAPSSGVGYTVANAGNAPARVKVELTAGSETDNNCQVENTTKGQIFNYRGVIAAADILEVDNRFDTDDFQVLNDGVSDFANFEGDFIDLNPGNNTIEYTGTAGPSIKLTWKDCWY